MNEGWICPRCKKSLAPWVRECDCPNYEDYPKYDPKMPSTGDPLPVSGYTVCNS